MVIKDRQTLALSFGIIFVIMGLVAIFYPNFNGYRSPSWSNNILAPALFFLIGLFVISMNPFTTINLDKVANRASVSWKTPFGKRAAEECGLG